jgi:hypothetical protein
MRTAALVAAFAVVAAVAAGRMKHDFGALDGLATMVAPVAVLIRSSASVIPRLLDVARLPEGPYGGLIFLCNPASHGESAAAVEVCERCYQSPDRPELGSARPRSTAREPPRRLLTRCAFS